MAEAASQKAGMKRKKSYYVKNAKRHTGRELAFGMKGVLITCSGQERKCVHEAYDLMNEIADIIYGPESHGKGSSDQESNEEDECDIEKKLVKEVQVLKEKKERRFNSLSSGAKNLVFIRCGDEVDPCELVHRILCDARDEGVRKTRFCTRFFPVSKIFTANLSEIKKHSISILSPHFHGLDPKPIEFAVHFKARNNTSIKREDVIDLMASLVTDDGTYPHIVNLRSPQLVVMVNIIKIYCCVSVVKDFFTLKQYNIQSLYPTTDDSESLPTSKSSAEENPSSSVATENDSGPITTDDA